MRQSSTYVTAELGPVNYDKYVLVFSICYTGYNNQCNDSMTTSLTWDQQSIMLYSFAIHDLPVMNSSAAQEFKTNKQTKIIIRYQNNHEGETNVTSAWPMAVKSKRISRSTVTASLRVLV